VSLGPLVPAKAGTQSLLINAQLLLDCRFRGNERRNYPVGAFGLGFGFALGFVAGAGFAAGAEN
jgi:hypothetical protein